MTTALATVPVFTMPDIERVALAICKGGLFGSTDPNQVLTLCLLAQAEGQHPAVVFRDYNIIKGKPAKKAEAMLRDFIAAGGKVEWHTLTDDVADATFSHPQGGSIRIDWTMKRAKQAGIANPMWQKYPRQMLRSRVVSEGVRSVCPSATSGLYETGEVQDIVAERVPVVAAQEGGGDNAESTMSPAADPHHTDDEPNQSYAFPEGPATGITQLKAMARSLWREIEGCGDNDELNCLLDTADNKAITKQLANLENPEHLKIWLGDGEDNPGIAGLITRKQTEFAQQMVDYVRAG